MIVTKFRSSLPVILAAALSTLGVSCKPSAISRVPLTIHLATQDFPSTIRIIANNNTDDPICIPADQISNGYLNLVISQGDKRVFPNTNANRAIREWKSINALDPVYIALKGDTVFYYDLSDFPLTDGPVQIRANIKAARCSTLFGRADPEWFVVASNLSFRYHHS